MIFWTTPLWCNPFREHSDLLAFVPLILTIPFIAWVFQQVRKPSGLFGRRILDAMNVSHAAMTDWGLQQLAVSKNAAILDVGCGGGRTVGALAALAPEGKVVGLDYSAASVAVSRKWNAREIAAGRVQIEQGSVAALPFPDGTFDVVTAVETHYYWPDLPANVREIRESAQTGWELYADRGDLPRRTAAVAVRDRDAFAARRVPERCGAPGAADASGVYRGDHRARAWKELDLRQRPPAMIGNDSEA